MGARSTLVAFLPDEDSFGLGESIRRHPVLTYQEVGLARGAPDNKVAEHARRHSAIVLSRNSRDFRRIMRASAEASSAGDCKAMHCHEGGGLVLVDRGISSFHFERVTRALELNKQPITWDEVYLLNLLVRINASDDAKVEFLPQCLRCLRNHTPDCERCRILNVFELYQAQLGLLEM